METAGWVLVAGLSLILLELRWPGRAFSEVRGWVPRAIGMIGVQALVTLYAALLWNDVMASNPIWHAGGHGVAIDALFGYFVITFVFYWWHRARHEVPVLWRWLHQIHHSASRIEVLTTFYKHPVEILINGVMSSFILYALLGLDPAAVALATTFTGLGELFYHWNGKTPYWLGFFFQRPESHCVHHQYGRHTGNFSDLPLWDMMFGTFENPRIAPNRCGFNPKAEARFVDMLLGRRV